MRSAVALDVFDQRHRDRGFIGHDAHDGGDVVQASHLRRAPAALTRDDLVARGLAGSLGCERPHDDRLDHPLRANGIRELLQALGPHVHARLVTPSLQEVDGYACELLVTRRGGSRGLDNFERRAVRNRRAGF